ncbi:efflux RND transporter periplasmic adaptor subunit [Marivirga sp. S37H4]|uniref:Efflux RND transporter periplasmic adaptor subunit n=1 Tax=Marivirga aurantiaca TaxID=2802615 RepID=A0A934X150_9BACT|nr:efflux RND transporter periplasmic adaptor subunit [Marivirga aurantiaca]MBK6266571.1 efflux RND transporter periplasmic adaptor subunit [Marivirga aurantiaca]
MNTSKTIKGLITFSILLGLVISLGACSTSESKDKVEIPVDKIPVKVWTIEKFQGTIPLHGSGQFTTEDETILSFKTGGIISEIHVSEGDYVRKGQTLASLDLTEINTSVIQAQLGYEKALRDYERIQRLLTDSVATLEQSQNSKTALDIAVQSLKAVQFNKEYSEIKAQKDGYVLRKYANSGQQIGSGSPVLQVSGAVKDNWKLKVALSDKDWALVSEGDTAHIHTSVNPEKSYLAEVSSKARQANPMTGTYSVELKFRNDAPAYLASGMFGTADIYSAQSTKAWNIPYEALLDANGGYGFVFVTESGETAKKVSVKVGKIYPDKVQILEGLESYSKLIISGSAYLNDNSSILIQQ